MKVAGNAFQTTFDFLQEKHGKEAGERLAAALKERGCDLKLPILVSTWYPFEQYEVLNRTADEIFGKGDGELLVAIGSYGAEQGFKMFGSLAPKTPDDFLKRIGTVFWPTYYDFGKPGLERVGENSAVVWFSEIPPTRVLCRRAFGFFRRALQLSGADILTEDETSCVARGGDKCELKITWA